METWALKYQESTGTECNNGEGAFSTTNVSYGVEMQSLKMISKETCHNHTIVYLPILFLFFNVALNILHTAHQWQDSTYHGHVLRILIYNIQPLIKRSICIYSSIYNFIISLTIATRKKIEIFWMITEFTTGNEIPFFFKQKVKGWEIKESTNSCKNFTKVSCVNFYLHAVALWLSITLPSINSNSVFSSPYLNRSNANLCA